MKKKFTVDYTGIQMSYTMMFAGISAFVSVFLLNNGFSNSEIGILVSAASMLTVICQPLIADFADRTKKAALTGIILHLVIAAGVLSGSLFFLRGHSAVLFAFYVMAIAMMNFAAPLVNSLSFQISSLGFPLNYGFCRAMGSVGYAAVTGVLGNLIEKYGINMIPAATEIALALLLICLYFTIRQMKQAEHAVRKTKSDIAAHTEDEAVSLSRFVKENIPFVLLNVGVMLVLFHQSVVGSFMIQIITPLGGGSAEMGTLFSLAAFIEAPVMMLTGPLNRRFGAVNLLRFSMFGFILKTFLIMVAPNIWFLYLAQATQIFGYALLYPSMVQFIGETMSSANAVKGQAFFTMMSTAAGVLANLTGGVILDLFGVRLLVTSCFAAAVLGAFFIWMNVGRVASPQKCSINLNMLERKNYGIQA